ncbi:hypothetical protein [Streptomyces sp. NPDC057438]|uniref:hypothetical protein n=1 Tax=Streptomyces sp. NPDC057438 TaxID=3346133 RepID=UPI003680CB81
MDLLRDLLSKEFVSALLGAVVGGIATFLVAMYQANKSLEALRHQDEAARKLAQEEREKAHAREAGLIIMDLLLEHRSGLRANWRDQDWLEDQEAVIDRIRSYARILPDGEHRTLLLKVLENLSRKRPVNYHPSTFKGDQVWMANAALVVIGSYLNNKKVETSPKLAEIQGEWDKADEEHYNQMMEAMQNDPLPDDWEDDSTPVPEGPSPST